MIAVTFAVKAESRSLLRLLENRTRTTYRDIATISGRLYGESVTVFHTGVGEKICRRRMAEFLQDRQFRLLISAGFAGALTNAFEVGTVLLAQNFSTVNLEMSRAALSHLKASPADLITVSRILGSHAERTRIAEQTAAAAVDMETEFIARACAARVVPLLAFRVISDTPSRPLAVPPDVLFDVAEQKTKLPRLGVHLAKHPLTLPRLVSFIRQVRAARSSLTIALETLLRSDFVAPFIS